MSSIQGLDRLIRKLEKVSDLPYSEIIQHAADEFKEALRSSAATFSTHSNYIDACDTRKGENYMYVDIGLRNGRNGATWEIWKHLYFHEYGYEQFFFGHDTHKKTTCHTMWFSGTVNSQKDATMQRIKQEIKRQIKNSGS